MEITEEWIKDGDITKKVITYSYSTGEIQAEINNENNKIKIQEKGIMRIREKIQKMKKPKLKKVEQLMEIE